MMAKYSVLLLTLAVSLSACTIGPDYIRPSAAKIDHIGRDLGEAKGGAFSHTDLPKQWWHLYENQVLDRLVAKALNDNSDIRIAAANIARANAYKTEASDMSSVHTDISGNFEYGARSAEEHLLFGNALPSDFAYSLGVGLSYPLDLSGQIKRAEQAAQADSETAQAVYDRVRLGIVVDVSRSYLDICAAGRDIELTKSLVLVQDQMRDANSKLVISGRASPVSQRDFEAKLWQQKSVIPILQARKKAAGYRLAALLSGTLNDLPSDVMRCHQVPLLEKPIPTGDGVVFLERRPDVQQAEAAAKAASARIGVAMGDLYPHVTLGISGASTGLLSHFGNADTYKYSLGPLITWEFPSRGAVKARIREAEANNAAALENFDKVVVNALRDGETALSAYAHDLDQNEDLKRASTNRDRELANSDALYEHGRLNVMDRLETRRTSIISAQELAQNQAKIAGDQVTLFWVLGGGW